MAQPLMPKATAVWLVENTALTFEQIAAFCGLHMLEIKAIADGEVASGMVGLDPILNGQLTRAEIDRCENDPAARLELSKTDNPVPLARAKGPRYTPVTKRGDKPDGIAWLLKFHPEIPDATICRLLGTTKPTIQAIRDRTHWNSANIKPRHPVQLGLCSPVELEELIARLSVSSDTPPEAAEEVLDDPDAPPPNPFQPLPSAGDGDTSPFGGGLADSTPTIETEWSGEDRPAPVTDEPEEKPEER